MKNTFITSIVKGVIVALIATIVGIFVFALIIKLTGLSTSTIKAVNQFIKIISVFLGCFFSLSGEKGLVKGGFIGIFYTLLVYLLFCLMGSNGLSGKFFVDLIFMSIIGGISGIILVNTRKNAQEN